MAEALKSRQRDDGTWNANLDDPNHFGGIETSGTVMFMYGYALGIRLGILDFNEYFPTLQKAYDGVVKYAINDKGRLLYVQPGSDSPQRYLNYENEDLRKDATRQYAVGIFLMAAGELMLLCDDYVEPELDVPEPDYVPIEKPTFDENYYKGKITATATAEQPGNTADKIVDKKLDDVNSMRWSADGYPQSVTLEFDKVLDIKKLTIVPYQNRAYIYKIEASIDGINYEEIVDNSENPLSWKYIDHEEDITAKYIRLTVTGCQNYSGTWVSINEILVYEKN